MNNDRDNYYSTHGTGYMDPDFEGIQPKTGDHPNTDTLSPRGLKPDSFLQSGTLLVRKWLIAFVILFNLMLFLLLTAMILVGAMKMKSVKLKIQRIENEKKVMNNYAEEWNLAIMHSFDEINKVRSNVKKPTPFQKSLFLFNNFSTFEKKFSMWVLLCHLWIIIISSNLINLP